MVFPGGVRLTAILMEYLEQIRTFFTCQTRSFWSVVQAVILQVPRTTRGVLGGVLVGDELLDSWNLDVLDEF